MTEHLKMGKDLKGAKILEYQIKERFKENELKSENNHSDEEDDDYEGYFLEPVSSNVNIAEKIAEANKKLLEEKNNDNNENRPKKVHFSDELINFDPNNSDDECAESSQNLVMSEENDNLKNNREEMIPENNKLTNVELKDELIVINKKFQLDLLEENKEIKELISDDASNTIQEKPDHFINVDTKLILVLVTNDQNSSSEYIARKEFAENQTSKEHFEKAEKTFNKKFVRPKSAKKSCEVSKVLPNLNYSLERKESKGCKTCSVIFKSNSKKDKKNDENFGDRNTKRKMVKQINLDSEELKKGDERKISCDKTETIRLVKKDSGNKFRQKSGSMKRNSFVLKTGLPNYNGFRSDYGLSAEQLEERKRKTLDLKRQKQQNKLKEREEVLKRRNKNDEVFQKWLFNKSKRQNNNYKSTKSIDTLTRSDSYILTHASYATNHNVPYSVNYGLVKKNHSTKKSRVIFINKLINKVTPNLKRSFNIYLGVKV